jgi:sugar/nucleoside kinase (ribokinase family)
MPLDILTFGEALMEIMRTGIDQPLDTPGPFEGPYPSGAPFIFTVAAARLGVKSACVGCVGEDAFGRFFVQQLRADGVETGCVSILPDHSTGVAFISYRNDGSRDFVFHMRHAAAGQLAPNRLDPALMDGLKLLHLSGSSLSMHDDALALGMKMLEIAQQAGMKISFDPNIRPQLIAIERAREAFAPFVAAADVILTTPEEAQILTNTRTLDDAIGALMGADLHRIIVTHQGKYGCGVYTSQGATQLPSYEIDEIDPTGAGDCFDAGFLVRWLEGAAPVDALRFANACGALAVTVRGPMAGAKTRTEVEAFMQERN